MGVRADVAMDAAASAAEVSEVERILREAGIEGPVTADIERRSAEPMPWVIYVTLAAPIGTFFSTLAAELAKDVYAAIKDLVRDLHAARGEARGAIDVRDPQGTSLILSAELPDEAIRALAELDWSSIEGGYLTWDDAAKEWRDFLAAR